MGHLDMSIILLSVSFFFHTQKKIRIYSRNSYSWSCIIVLLFSIELLPYQLYLMCNTDLTLIYWYSHFWATFTGVAIMFPIYNTFMSGNVTIPLTKNVPVCFVPPTPAHIAARSTVKSNPNTKECDFDHIYYLHIFAQFCFQKGSQVLCYHICVCCFEVSLHIKLMIFFVFEHCVILLFIVK